MVTATASLRSVVGAFGARTWAVLATSVFLVVYVATYARVISPLYVGSGLANELPPDGSIVLAVLAAGLPALWLPLMASRPSSVALWIVYLGGFVPSMIVPSFVLGAGWALAPYWLALTGSFVVTVLAVRSIRLRLPSVSPSVAAYRRLLIVLAVAGALAMVALFGMPTRLPGLDAVYDVRSDFTESLERAGRIGGYAVWWSGTAIAPLLVAYGAWRRRPLMIVGGLGLLSLVYALAAFRSVLFTAVVLLATLWLVRRMPRRLGIVIPAVTTALVIACAAVAVAGWIIPLSLAVRRLLVVPGQVIAYYYDEFATGPHYLLSHSILSSVTDSPYLVPPPVLIGRSYFGQAQHANGNLWADGLANFGIPGLVVASLLLAVLLIVLDAAARHKPPAVAVAVGGLSLWSVTNSGLLTALMTHGIGLTLLLLWLLPHRSQPPDDRSRRVVHITTVHRSDDPRILLKECASLALSGYDVTLVGRGAAPATLPDGVRFVGIGDSTSRGVRITVLQMRALVRAWRLRAAVYHVHDPELLPTAILLKLTGARVLYDAHEDVPRQVEYKHYLPGATRRPLAILAAASEQFAARVIDGVIAATPRIAARFPARSTTVVQNFPLMTEFGERVPAPYSGRPLTVAYVGRVTEAIGGEVMARAAGILAREDVRFVLAGPVEVGLAERLLVLARPARLELPGWMSRGEVVALLDEARVGMVLFQPLGNYVEAYPTKLFEYMASGIPVVASDFALWRSIISEADAGILVDPTDAFSVAAAVERLLSDEPMAAAMGARGRRAVLERYRWEDQAARLRERYDRLTDRRSGRSAATTNSAGYAFNR